MERTAFCFGLIGFSLFTMATNVQAQTVISDGTLNTIVNSLNDRDFTINNGNTAGGNLFHSFREFSIPTGGSAVFNNAVDVQNIFSRVTGSSISNIDGVIRANGSANLFLLNPNGILFGPNASLNLGGSFLGTTASSIKFADNLEFDSTNPAPLLTMSVPIGLQMGQNPGAIVVQGSGHQLVRTSFFYPTLQLSPSTGLQVNSGNALVLIGSTIDLNGGVLNAPSGQVELASTTTGNVGINTTQSRWEFDYGNVQQFGDIRLTQQALVDGSGMPAGTVQLQGQNISVLEGSVVRLQNWGRTALGDLVVNAKGLLELRQVGTNGFQSSLLITENLGDGSGSNLLVSAQRLQMHDGGGVMTAAFGPGSGGNITLKVPDTITVDGWSALDPTVLSSIAPVTLGTGKGGDVTVSSGQLRFTNGGNILNLTAGSGLGGNIAVTAIDRVEITRENPITFATSAIATLSLFSGNGGNVSVTAPTISVQEGGGIGASTFGAGNGGNLTILASNRIEVAGTALASMQPSRIVAKAEVLPALTRQAYGLPPFPTGNAGALAITTPLLQVSNGALIGVDHQGIGNAGNLQVIADRVALDQQGLMTAATLSGEGGNINLNIKELLSLGYNSTIATAANTKGNGGNITISAPVVLGFKNSDIIANAVKGRGGNISITTQGMFGLKYRDRLTSESDITASSEFGISGTVEVNNVGVDPNSGLIELPGDIVDSSQQVAQTCNSTQDSSFTITGRGGVPSNPTQTVIINRPWSDLRPLQSATIATQPTIAQPLQEATNWTKDPHTGQIVILAAKPTIAAQIHTCAKF